MIDPQSRLPGVLKTLLLLNVGVFVVGMFADALRLPYGNMLFSYGALVPDLVWGRWQLWRVFTYMFLHGGLMHIAFNMLSLWMFGTPLVHQMGERRFLALYLVSGIVAGLGSALFYFVGGSGGTYIVGASGAIFGVMLAFARFYPHVQILVFFFFPMPARYAVWVFGGISFLAGLGGGMGGGVAHFTHLFGIFGGWAYLRLEEPLVLWATRALTARDRARTVKAAEELVTREEYFDTRVDPILKKISKHGIDSLTKQERIILERASVMKKPASTVDLQAWRRDRDR